MDSKQSFSDHPQPSLDSLVAQWAATITIFGLLVVLLTTLYPFRFQAWGDVVQQFIHSVHLRTNLPDVVANVLLFCPLGFGLAGMLYRCQPKAIASSITVLGISAALSLGVEMLQVFLPGRAATLPDIATNGFGGYVGAYCFQRWGFEVLSLFSALADRGRKVLFTLPVKVLVAMFLGYMVLAFGVVTTLQATTLNNWDVTVPLLLGNRKTLGLAWDGTISNLQIADRAVSKQEAQRILAGEDTPLFRGPSLVASYPLQGQGPYPDQRGNLPDLVWRGQSPTTAPEERGSLLSRDRWLETAAPATPLSQRLRQTSQFTLMMTIAPASLDKQRVGEIDTILSIAGSPSQHNFVLGQSGDFLMFWLRTSLKPRQRSEPDGFMMGVFRDTTPQRLLITYSGSILRFYSEQPDIREVFDLTSANYRIIMQGLVFAPLGFLLAFTLTRLKGQFVVRLLFFASGALLPPLLLEGLVVAATNRNLSRANLLLGLLIMVSTLVIVHGKSLLAITQRRRSATL